MFYFLTVIFLFFICSSEAIKTDKSVCHINISQELSENSMEATLVVHVRHIYKSVKRPTLQAYGPVVRKEEYVPLSTGDSVVVTFHDSSELTDQATHNLTLAFVGTHLLAAVQFVSIKREKTIEEEWSCRNATLKWPFSSQDEMKLKLLEGTTVVRDVIKMYYDYLIITPAVVSITAAEVRGEAVHTCVNVTSNIACLMFVWILKTLYLSDT